MHGPGLPASNIPPPGRGHLAKWRIRNGRSSADFSVPRLAVSFLITYLLTYLLTTDHRTRNARTRAWVASPADSKTVCKSGNPRLAVIVPYPFAVPLALPVARWFISNYGSLGVE